MLGDDLAAVLPSLQAQAESMMVTPCRVRRILSVTPDPITGADVITYAEPDPYEGVCKVQDKDLVPSPEQIPGATIPTFRLEVHVPVGAGPFEVGDIVEVLDGETVTRSLRIAGLHRKSWQTAQRLPVTEL